MHYTKSDLKGRGWTAGLIQKFLPLADEMTANPHYRSGPPMRLYLQERVHAVEASEQFQAAKAMLAKRQAGGVQAVATKRRKLEDHLAEVRIKVPIVDSGLR